MLEETLELQSLSNKIDVLSVLAIDVGNFFSSKTIGVSGSGSVSVSDDVYDEIWGDGSDDDYDDDYDDDDDDLMSNGTNAHQVASVPVIVVTAIVCVLIVSVMWLLLSIFCFKRSSGSNSASLLPSDQLNSLSSSSHDPSILPSRLRKTFKGIASLFRSQSSSTRYQNVLDSSTHNPVVLLPDSLDDDEVIEGGGRGEQSSATATIRFPELEMQSFKQESRSDPSPTSYIYGIKEEEDNLDGKVNYKVFIINTILFYTIYYDSNIIH
jgi:hypothetical protein